MADRFRQIVYQNDQQIFEARKWNDTE